MLTFIIILFFLVCFILAYSTYLILKVDISPECHICGGKTEPEWICDKCDQFYCENCSAPFTYMTQIDYPCCEYCYNVYHD